MLHRRFFLLGNTLQSFGKDPGTLLAVYEDPAVALADLRETREEKVSPTVVYWIQEGFTGDPQTYPLKPFGTQFDTDTGLKVIRRVPGQLTTAVLTDEQYKAFEAVRETLVDLCSKNDDMLTTGAQMMITALDSFQASFLEPRPR
jgi:hypothetical protein